MDLYTENFNVKRGMEESFKKTLSSILPRNADVELFLHKDFTKVTIGLSSNAKRIFNKIRRSGLVL